MWRLQISEARRVLVHLLVLSFLACIPATLAQDRPDESQHTFPLQYRAHGFSLQLEVPLSDREVAFKKESDFGERDIVRGALTTGPEDSDFLGFAWDGTKGTLYLDLNSNLDLTDDASGIFKTNPDQFWQSFQDMKITFGHLDIPLRYTMDMGLCQYPNWGAQCTATIQSGWQGEVELHGSKWLLSVVDNMDGNIDTADRFILQPMVPGGAVGPISPADKLSAARSISLAGHHYELGFAFKRVQTNTVLVVTFTESHPATGELLIEGLFIKRLLLKGPHTVVLDRPPSNTRIPAGQYYSGVAFLAETNSADLFQADLGEITIADTGSTSLKVGGPLNGRVKARREAGCLRLDHRLTGIGGRRYNRNPLDESVHPPPRYTIRRDGRKVASGSFEYG